MFAPFTRSSYFFTQQWVQFGKGLLESRNNHLASKMPLEANKMISKKASIATGATLATVGAFASLAAGAWGAATKAAEGRG